MAHRTVADLTDLELEEQIEALEQERLRRESVALKAIGKQFAILPPRMYAGVR